MMGYYAGIGSRTTPPEICKFMTDIATVLCQYGMVLRSGGAEGADKAFEKGAGNRKEIYLPWKKYNGNPSWLYPPSEEAIETSSKFHPAWHACTRPARLLLGRNSHQILGDDLSTPVNFVICWTYNGKDVGGTGVAIRLAQSRKINVWNLFNEEHRAIIKRIVE